MHREFNGEIKSELLELSFPTKYFSYGIQYLIVIYFIHLIYKKTSLKLNLEVKKQIYANNNYVAPLE